MQNTKTKTKKTAKLSSSEILSNVIIEGMLNKKASEIVIIDLRSIKGTIADFFVLCTGNSDTHVDAISDSVEDYVFKMVQQDPWHIEGKQNKEWILLDYVDVVVNIFKSGSRKFYSLEQLWGDAGIRWIDNGN
ncbi:MAG TPA: ribosome silencing factor [Cyclobacteriaceae bacterium]|nr:ribosome silencing factor [Cyclobacteriaceae bacterium]